MRRRQFLSRSVQVAAVTSAASAQRVLGANERVRVGWIGCGGRGMYDARHMQREADVEFVGACDVYEPNAAKAKAWAGARCRTYTDFRKLLEQQDIDAVLLATPDHWHAIPTVLACQAGKDVYVEKPLAHNIREGRAMVEAAREHQRVVQTGMQHRSAAHYRAAAEIIQSGELGPIHLVRIWNYSNVYPNGIGPPTDAAMPVGLDWDFYLGPAPRVPFDRHRFLGTFRWFWDYAGGRITDWGTHRFDSLHQMMGVDAPLTVSAAGKHRDLGDGTETPNIIQATYEYPDFVLSYEACNLNAHGAGGRTTGKRYYASRGDDDRPNGTAIYGANGTLVIDRIGFEIYPEPVRTWRRGRGQPALRTKRRDVAGRDSTDLHMKNFIDCVRSRQKPAADVEIGHRSSIVPHLGNIAYRTGQKLRWDAGKELIVGDDKASALLGRAARKPWNLI